MDFNFMGLESRHSKLLSTGPGKKEIAEVFFQPCWFYIPVIQGVGMVTDLQMEHRESKGLIYSC